MRRYFRRHIRRHVRGTSRQPPHQSWFVRYHYQILIVVIATLVITRCSLDFIWSDTNPMQARFDAIAYGMTSQDVSNILGEPNPHPPGETDNFEMWAGNWGLIVVTFDNRRVSKK